MSFFLTLCNDACRIVVQSIAGVLHMSPNETGRIIRYAISGGLGAVLQVFFLWMFVDLFGLWYVYGVVSAFFITLIIIFTLQKVWTFEDYSLETVQKQSIVYTAVALIALGLNVLLMYIFVDILHVWHLLAQGVVAGLVGIASFLTNKKFTFNAGKPTDTL